MKKLFQVQLIVVLLLTSVINFANAQKGSQYDNFPERFENPGTMDGGYNQKIFNLSSGRWLLSGARIDSVKNHDKPTSGLYALRFAGNNLTPCFAEMQFDVAEGASKVILWFSSYGAKADKPTVFKLEYSTDKGKTWIQTGKDVAVTNKNKQGYTFDMDLSGKVRFRILKPDLGSSEKDPTISNGRLSIDDFSIYKNQ